MKAKKIWPEIEIFQIFTDNIDNYVEIWIKTEPKKRRKQSRGNNMKSYTHNALESVIPNTRAKKIWLKLERFNFETENSRI